MLAQRGGPADRQTPLGNDALIHQVSPSPARWPDSRPNRFRFRHGAAVQDIGHGGGYSQTCLLLQLRTRVIHHQLPRPGILSARWKGSPASPQSFGLPPLHSWANLIQIFLNSRMGSAPLGWKAARSCTPPRGEVDLDQPIVAGALPKARGRYCRRARAFKVILNRPVRSPICR